MISKGVSVKSGALLEKIQSRISFDKEEGDIAYYYALLHQLEYLTKVVVAGVVSCLGDDADRNRYSIEYKLVRANSIGDWVSALQHALTGPPAQFFKPSSSHVLRELTERVSDNDWRFRAVEMIGGVARGLGLDARIGAKVALRQFFEFASAIRNRTRGHGAITSEQCHDLCPQLSDAMRIFIENSEIFRGDWAHLYRNLSGKYRVSPLLGECEILDYLKRSKDSAVPDGVYFILGDELSPVPLIITGPGADDIFVPNGNYRSDEFEVLSLISNEVKRVNGGQWSIPPGRLPPSHTEGRSHLDQLGNVFTNLPELPRGHISRDQLEKALKNQLLNLERHPVITLTGPGGIGKTTLTLAVVEQIATSSDCPYEVILWMSSRDVDLLDSGPKPVRAKVVTKEAISDSSADLMNPSNRKDKGFNSKMFFEKCLSEGAAGTTLFILDNFETVEDPVEVYRWVDAHLKHPNKVLITTRFRDFQGDYPIEIHGMNDSEALRLIDQEAGRLGISDLISKDYAHGIIDESDGHPYVIKILLGQVSKENRAVSPERIIAGSDQLLTALFERTYLGLSPAAQRVFLLLSSWRSFVPSVAVEAVSLRPENEKFNVSSAIGELRRYSLVEEVDGSLDGEIFIGVPLAAASFGRRKLEASPFKVAVEHDKKILMEFGAGDRDSSRHGVMPRIDRLVAAAASRAAENPDSLQSILPILEYLGGRVPKAFLRIATLLSEVSADKNIKQIKMYLRRYLESSDQSERERAWFWLADLCHLDGDAIGEAHALSEIVMLPGSTLETIGIVANRMNNKLRELKGRDIEESWSNEVQQLIQKVAETMNLHIGSLDSTGCSRLAWLYLNIGKVDRARDVTGIGLEKDPFNEHCLRLMERLDK